MRDWALLLAFRVFARGGESRSIPCPCGFRALTPDFGFAICGFSGGIVPRKGQSTNATTYRRTPRQVHADMLLRLHGSGQPRQGRQGLVLQGEGAAHGEIPPLAYGPGNDLNLQMPPHVPLARFRDAACVSMGEFYPTTNH